MKRFIKTVLCAAVAAMLLAALGITAMAAENSIGDAASPGTTTSPISDVTNQSDLLRNVASPGATISPISENVPNPATGMESLAIPGAVALIAAASAAVTLVGKRK